MRHAILALYVLMLGACGGPFLLLPGGALEGPERSIAAIELSGEGAVVQLETRPSNPYSVNLNAVYRGNTVYLDPAEERTWYAHLLADPNVRIKISGDEHVYTAVAVAETDQEIVAGFDPERIVMRLDPR